MSNEEKSEVKNTLRKEFLLPALGLLAILAGFYYNTNSSLAEHKEELSSLKMEIRSKASIEDMKDLKQDMRDLQASNQKILELLLENNK
jgi:hypothetical protein